MRVSCVFDGIKNFDKITQILTAELAQSVERTTLNRVVVGSIPTFGDLF